MAAEAGRPWRVAGALAATQLIHWGTLYYAFAVLAPAMAAELGAARESVVAAFSAGLLAQGVAAPLAGRLIDRRGARGAMAGGALAAAAGLLLASRAEALWQLGAAWLLVGAAMAFTLYEAAFAAVTAAFGAARARRGIAAVTLVGGFASTLAWPLAALLLEAQGWRATLAWLAAANLGCALLHLGLLPGRAAAGAVLAAPADALRAVLAQGRFWALWLALMSVAALSASMAVHLVAVLGGKGLGAGAALAVAALLGPMQVAGRLLEMALGRRAPARAVGVVALAGLVLALGGLALAQGPVAAALAVCAYGAANGVLTIIRGAAPVEIFGAGAYASVLGVVAAGSAAAAAGGPLAVAAIWRASGGAGLPLLAMAALAALALLCFRAATRRA